MRLHLSRLYLPHSITPTRQSDKHTIAHQIVHFLDSLAHRTLIILTPFLPRTRDLLTLLLCKFVVIKVRILDARRENVLDMHKQIVKRHSNPVGRRHSMYHGNREWYSFMYGVGGSVVIREPCKVVARDGAF